MRALTKFGLIWLLLGQAIELSIAGTLPHVDIDVRYREQTAVLEVSASTKLTTEHGRFFLNKNIPITRADALTNVKITDGPNFISFELTNESSGLIELEYSIDLRTKKYSSGSGVAEQQNALGSADNAFLSASELWHPLFNGPFTSRVRIRSSTSLSSIAPGMLVSDTVSDDTRIRTFELKQPTLAIDLMFGRWEVQHARMSGKSREIDLYTYFNEGNSSLANEYLNLTKDYILFYENLIGDYPFNSFSVVASHLPTGLGMPSLTYISERILKYPFIKNRSLPHEILHNWLGNGIFIDYQSGNWSEGLTTYLADYMMTELRSESEAREMRHGWLRNYASIEESGSEESLSEFSSRYHTASSAIGYGKSAMVFHMLRRMIGDESFKACIKEFWNRYQFEIAGFKDIEGTCQSFTEYDLSSFFKNWVETKGAPRLNIELTQSENIGNTLDVTQDGEWIHPLDIVFEGASKSETTRLLVSEHRTTLPRITVANAESIFIDPDFHSWRKLFPEEIPATIRDFIAAERTNYSQVSTNVNLESSLNRYFLENATQPIAREPKPLPHKIPSIKVISTQSVASLIEDGEIELQFKDPHDLEFMMFASKIDDQATLYVAVDDNLGPERIEAHIARARHYGKYSWLTINSGGEIVKGKQKINPHSFTVR